MRGKSLFGVTIELARDLRHSFKGSFQARALAGAVVTEMRASSYRVNRTEADIARIAGDSLCIGLQVKGSGFLHAGRDRVHNVSGGDITINYSDLPYDAIPGDEAAFHYRMLKIPVHYEVMLGQPTDDLFATRYAENTAVFRPFRALFDALNADHTRLIDPTRDVAHSAVPRGGSRRVFTRNMPARRPASCSFSMRPSSISYEIGETISLTTRFSSMVMKYIH